MVAIAKAVAALLVTVLLLTAAALAWLRWDAGRDREGYFDRRQGQLVEIGITPSAGKERRVNDGVTLRADSGLTVFCRVLRPARQRLPVLVVLGGHRTGSEAVELFPFPEEYAIVALDYPYTGPERVKGLVQSIRTIPLARRAMLDTPPAISLVVDWLHRQPWADTGRIVMTGVSLGVPFAATAAARDRRLSGLLLVHGAADNRLWLEANVARRMETDWLRPALATLLHWLAYGPVFDTAERVAAVAPRPVLIVGARHDERTPAGQTEALFLAAREPKKLRWTEGRHVGPGREGVIDELLEIAREELPFAASGAGSPR